MPIEISCSSCQAKLRVPDALVGKKVRCTKCKTEFTAVAEELPVEIVEETPEPVVADEEGLEIVEENAPVRAGPPRRDDRRERDDDETVRAGRPRREDRRDFEDDEVVEERRRPRRKRQRRTHPHDAVRAPAMGLMIVAYAGAALNFIGIIFNVVATIGAAASAPKGAGAGGQVAGMVFGVLLSLAITAAWAGAIIRGANSMSCLSDYSMAMVGCVVAMLPCSLGCLGGLPLGIWGMITLLNEDVKRAFR
jgi:predicted Zn finger-like uncharacterized protein